LTWEVIRICGAQVRAAFGGAYALDFGAFFLTAAAMQVNPRLLADVLPSVEAVVVRAYQKSETDK
jgi:hypothetical protein